MDCPTTKSWLLQADDPRFESCPSPAIAGHLQTCAECQELSRDLLKLEAAWRGIPLPAVAKQSRTRFLKSLPLRIAERRRRRVLARFAAAAAVLVVVGLATWLTFFFPREAAASDDVVTQLVDWNLELTQAQKIEERSRIFAEQIDDVEGELKVAKLSPDDRKLADQLLANARWLAKNDDPVAEAERLNEVAETLAQRMAALAEKGSPEELDRVGNQYRQVNLGLATSVTRASGAAVVPPKLQKLKEYAHARSVNIDRLLTRIPPTVRVTLRDALDGRSKAAKAGSKNQTKKKTVR